MKTAKEEATKAWTNSKEGQACYFSASLTICQKENVRRWTKKRFAPHHSEIDTIKTKKSWAYKLRDIYNSP